MSASASLTGLVRRVAKTLDEAGFAYAVIGAFGRNAWARPRATTDADFAVAVPATRVDELRALIASLNLATRRGHADPGEVPPLFLLVAQTPFEDEVLARRLPAAIAGATLWVATPEFGPPTSPSAPCRRSRSSSRAGWGPVRWSSRSAPIRGRRAASGTFCFADATRSCAAARSRARGPAADRCGTGATLR